MMAMSVFYPSCLSLMASVTVSTRPHSTALEAGCCPGSWLCAQSIHTTALFAEVSFLVHLTNITDWQGFRIIRPEALLWSGKSAPMAIYHLIWPPLVTASEGFVINFQFYAVAPACPFFMCEMMKFILNFLMYYSLLSLRAIVFYFINLHPTLLTTLDPGVSSLIAIP